MPVTPETPNELKTHQNDYKEGAWRDYSLFELGMFVHLLRKRAQHRSNVDKARKALYDAQNYLKMMQAHLDAAFADLQG